MDIVLRATAMFVLLYALIRLLGKRELGQMTLSNSCCWSSWAT